MSHERALALQQRGLHDWVALLGSSSPGAQIWERDAVIASIVPCCPQRSICNSVAYADADALAASLDQLADVYERTGIAAWTVWTPEFDRATIELLEGLGHKLDGSPRAMSIDVADFEPLDLGDLEWDHDLDPADLGRVNDLAYALPADSGVGDALAGLPDLEQLRLYRVRVEGEVACVMATLDHGGDLGVYFVATHPDHRGRGLASRLMSVALVEGRGRGLETSSLQGSPMGRSIYVRLGYSEDFTMNMYERRR